MNDVTIILNNQEAAKTTEAVLKQFYIKYTAQGERKSKILGNDYRFVITGLKDPIERFNFTESLITCISRRLNMVFESVATSNPYYIQIKEPSS